MKMIFKETTLSDNSKVHDVQLISNGKSSITGNSVCIFTCTSERDAISFLTGLEKLVSKHTVEHIEEVSDN